MTTEEKNALIDTARFAIKSYFTGGKLSADSVSDQLNKNPGLKSAMGAFVTLWENEALRGCVGYITAEDDLIRTVFNAARQAAFRDTRFPPLREVEYDEIDIEISVLSQPFKMNSYDDIIIGKHGLILSEAGVRALLLPQVAVEHNMNVDEFLEALCQKGGLNGNLWKTKQLSIELFTAEVFGEKRTENK